MKSEALLEARLLEAGYGEKKVIRGVSLEVYAGNITGLMGGNGSGKTTLLRCLANQLPHGGNCYVKGEKAESMSLRTLASQISYLPQRSGVTIDLPVLDVVLMGVNTRLKLLQNPTGKQKEMAREALRKVGLEKEGESNYLSLSEGQKQLVMLARMMVEETDLFLLDEPDSALDIPNRYLMMGYLRDMVMEQEKAALICLHDAVLALEFCDVLLLLKEGRIQHRVFPKKDSLETIEKAFQNIYGNVRVLECYDKEGKRHFTVLG